jgi:murein DD-endopeptidase MepM/ murein hydrolase activator NlpD
MRLDNQRWKNHARRNDRLPGHIHLLALACASIVVTLAFALPAGNSDHGLANNKPAFGALTQVPLPLPSSSDTALSQGESTRTDAVGRWQTATVRSGDTVTEILSRLGVRSEDLYTLIRSSEQASGLKQVRPGEVFRIRKDLDGKLMELVHEPNKVRGLRLVRNADTFNAQEYSHEIEKRTAFSTGVIRSSLYQSALQAGLSDRLIMEMVEIFAWDIDFALEIRPGDRFAVIYLEDYRAGERVGNGEILAAEFTNRGTTYRAVRYENPNGVGAYYTPEGRQMKQSFLRTPVDFRRISSHFQPNRWHPILGKRRPHQGVDYAAATGTPVAASGDGTVVFVGRKGGYGNTIILKHYDHYTTLYGHLSRFHKGLRKGHHVKQGQIIGYVGKTGLATGPHLHYEFRIGGVHKDPVTVKLPGSPPMERRYLADFYAKTARVVAQLDIVSRNASQLAMNAR